ncbi:MAG: hypothetical protein HND51_08900 [Chloroflexi bacterium]|nr:hypothetical protein [Chloroflexota bacterium]
MVGATGRSPLRGAVMVGQWGFGDETMTGVARYAPTMAKEISRAQAVE